MASEATPKTSSIPPEKARDIPGEVLKLIGYDFGGPYLGFVEEGRMRDEYFHEGGWHDMLRHSLLRPDYDGVPWRPPQPTM